MMRIEFLPHRHFQAYSGISPSQKLIIHAAFERLLQCCTAKIETAFIGCEEEYFDVYFYLL